MEGVPEVLGEDRQVGRVDQRATQPRRARQVEQKKQVEEPGCADDAEGNLWAAAEEIVEGGYNKYLFVRL